MVALSNTGVYGRPLPVAPGVKPTTSVQQLIPVVQVLAARRTFLSEVLPKNAFTGAFETEGGESVVTVALPLL